MSDLIEAWVLAECHVVLQDLTQTRGKVGKPNIHKPLRGLHNFFSESIKMRKAIYHS